MAKDKKPLGLGKRKTPKATADEESIDIELYFPVADEQDDWQQVLAMYKHAEQVREDPQQALPLFRAVVHECDRLAKLKEQLEVRNSPEDLDEETREMLSKFKMDASFFRVFGDALFRLACFEPSDYNKDALDEETSHVDTSPNEETSNMDTSTDEEEESSVNKDLLLAALDKYETGLELFRKDDQLCFSNALAAFVACDLQLRSDSDEIITKIVDIICSKKFAANVVNAVVETVELSQCNENLTAQLLDKVMDVIKVELESDREKDNDYKDKEKLLALYA